MDILDVQIKATESCAEPSFLVVETMFKVDVKITALSALLWQDRVAAHSQTLSIPTVGNVAEISLRIPRSSTEYSVGWFRKSLMRRGLPSIVRSLVQSKRI